MTGTATAALAVAGALLLAAGVALGRLTARRGTKPDLDLGTPVERATFHTLHTASLAAPRCARASPRTPHARPPGGCAPCSAPRRCASPTVNPCSPGTVPAPTTTSNG